MDCYQKLITPEKKVVLLIDPDKVDETGISKTLKLAESTGVSMIFVGGSLSGANIDDVIELVKQYTSLPVVIFPGSILQLSKKADAILFLSLVSGRNPEYLIGNQVQAAPVLKQLQLETISTGYILIEGGVTTSVEYISNTKPIPGNKPDLVVATALASEMLGHKLVYLEAGSGAEQPVPANVIKEVRKNINLPIIVGGGINSKEKVESAFDAGADIVVIGTAIEMNPSDLEQLTGALLP